MERCGVMMVINICTPCSKCCLILLPVRHWDTSHEKKKQIKKQLTNDDENDSIPQFFFYFPHAYTKHTEIDLCR